MAYDKDNTSLREVAVTIRQASSPVTYPGGSENMKLWHMFSADECYKMKTFLAGALWCADLGSIPGFGDDVEGSGLKGIFVSCWHASKGDPSPKMWEIFEKNGDGFAIQTTPDVLKQCAENFSNPKLAAKFGEVKYVGGRKAIRNAAFQVLNHHGHEDEWRFALELQEQVKDEAQIKKKKIIRCAVSKEYEVRDFGTKIEQLSLSTRDDSDFALLLPVDMSVLFKEFLIGPRVSCDKKHKAIKALRNAGIQCPVRVLKNR